MSIKSEYVKQWRSKTKGRMIESMGGQCQCCGYNRCNDALDFHHLDPSQKEFHFGKIMANGKSWSKIVDELKKCILLCSNCHREIHAGIRKIPENFIRFINKYADYKTLEEIDRFDACPVCGKSKSIRHYTCSLSCRSRMRYGKKWDEFDIVDLIENQKMNYSQIGRLVGCSGNAVKKRYKKIKNSLI